MHTLRVDPFWDHQHAFLAPVLPNLCPHNARSWLCDANDQRRVFRNSDFRLPFCTHTLGQRGFFAQVFPSFLNTLSTVSVSQKTRSRPLNQFRRFIFSQFRVCLHLIAGISFLSQVIVLHFIALKDLFPLSCDRMCVITCVHWRHPLWPLIRPYTSTHTHTLAPFVSLSLFQGHFCKRGDEASAFFDSLMAKF